MNYPDGFDFVGPGADNRGIDCSTTANIFSNELAALKKYLSFNPRLCNASELLADTEWNSPPVSST